MLTETKEALDKVLPKVINTMLSTKFWISVAMMYVGYTQGGIEGLLMVATGGAGYLATKTVQNLQYIKAEEQANTQAAAGNPPVAQTGAFFSEASTETAQPVASAPLQGSAAPVPAVAAPIPFDAAAFMDKTMTKVGRMYGEINDNTILYTAQSTYSHDWPFTDDSQRRDAMDLLVSLSKKAFKEIWGTSFEDELTMPVKPEDCTRKNMRERAISKGTGYYTSYLQVIDMEKQRAQLG